MTDAFLLKTVAREFAATRGFKDAVPVGKGAFKETYKVTHPDGKAVALKIVDPQKCDTHRSEREIDALQKCDTPLFGKLYEFG